MFSFSTENAQTKWNLSKLGPNYASQVDQFAQFAQFALVLFFFAALGLWATKDMDQFGYTKYVQGVAWISGARGASGESGEAAS